MTVRPHPVVLAVCITMGAPEPAHQRVGERQGVCGGGLGVFGHSTIAIRFVGHHMLGAPGNSTHVLFTPRRCVEAEETRCAKGIHTITHGTHSVDVRTHTCNTHPSLPLRPNP